MRQQWDLTSSINGTGVSFEFHSLQSLLYPLHLHWKWPGATSAGLDVVRYLSCSGFEV